MKNTKTQSKGVKAGICTRKYCAYRGGGQA